MKRALAKGISGYSVTTLGVPAIDLAFAACPNPVTPTADQVATPTFSHAVGTYGGDQTVTIGCSTSGATIYYTTDGTGSSGSSAAYDSAIAMAGDTTSMTVKAIAVKSGMSDSAVAQASYAIHYAGTLGANNRMMKVAVQSDRKVLVGGYFTTNGTIQGRVARLWK
jgi:hypothetical protein